MSLEALTPDRLDIVYENPNSRTKAVRHLRVGWNLIFKSVERRRATGVNHVDCFACDINVPTHCTGNR